MPVKTVEAKPGNTVVMGSAPAIVSADWFKPLVYEEQPRQNFPIAQDLRKAIDELAFNDRQSPILSITNF